jgi:hypothetical protein
MIITAFVAIVLMAVASIITLQFLNNTISGVIAAFCGLLAVMCAVNFSVPGSAAVGFIAMVAAIGAAAVSFFSSKPKYFFYCSLPFLFFMAMYIGLVRGVG